MTTTFYKLHHSNDNTKECYVGSTSDFAKRKSNHKHSCNNPNNNRHHLKVYRYIRANGWFNNWTFTVLEQRNNLTKQRKLLRERELTEQHGATLNTQKAGAFIEVGAQAYHHAQYQENRQLFLDRARQQADTDNICDRCNNMYRGKSHKTQHQRTKKCQKLTAQRAAAQPPIIININIENVNINA